MLKKKFALLLKSGTILTSVIDRSGPYEITRGKQYVMVDDATEVKGDIRMNNAFLPIVGDTGCKSLVTYLAFDVVRAVR
jgi:hypothetical protein